MRADRTRAAGTKPRGDMDIHHPADLISAMMGCQCHTSTCSGSSPEPADGNGYITHVELVPDIDKEPDYARALAAVRSRLRTRRPPVRPPRPMVAPHPQRA
jgi:hypothetical protein